MVESYFRALATEVREMLAAMGAASIDEIVGAADRLEAKSEEAQGILFTLLRPAEGRAPAERRETEHIGA